MDDAVESSSDEGFLSQLECDLDWDDVAEAFVGSLLAGVVLLLIARALPARKR